jgi:nitroreductase
MALLQGRRSIRRFRPEPVPRHEIQHLIEAASWAPSAHNRQDWLFIVVSSSELIRTMADTARRAWEEIADSYAESGVADEVKRSASSFSGFAAAPVVVAVAAARVNHVQRTLLGSVAEVTSGGRASAAMAAQNFMLAAHARDLGSCCLTGPLAASDELERLLGLPRSRELVCLIALGYPDESPRAPSRKVMGQIARFLE